MTLSVKFILQLIKFNSKNELTDVIFFKPI